MLEEITEEQLDEVYSWVDEIPLSRRKKNINRDFSDAVLLAEIVHYFDPKRVDLHNYNPANSVEKKVVNWQLINSRLLTRTGALQNRLRAERGLDQEPGPLGAVRDREAAAPTEAQTVEGGPAQRRPGGGGGAGLGHPGHPEGRAAGGDARNNRHPAREGGATLEQAGREGQEDRAAGIAAEEQVLISFDQMHLLLICLVLLLALLAILLAVRRFLRRSKDSLRKRKLALRRQYFQELPESRMRKKFKLSYRELQGQISSDEEQLNLFSTTFTNTLSNMKTEAADVRPRLSEVPRIRFSQSLREVAAFRAEDEPAKLRREVCEEIDSEDVPITS